MRFPIFRATLDLNGAQGPLGNYVNMSDIQPTEAACGGGVVIPVIQVDMLSEGEVTPLVLGCTENEAAALLTTLRLALEETERLNAEQGGSVHPLGASHLDAEPVGGTAKADPMQEYEESAERLRQKREAFRRGEPDPHPTTGTGNFNAFDQFFGTGNDIVRELSPEMMARLETLGQSMMDTNPGLVNDLLAKQSKKICDACKGKGIVKQGQGVLILQITCGTCGGRGVVNIDPPAEAAPVPPPTDPAPVPATDAAPIPPTNTDGAPVPDALPSTPT